MLKLAAIAALALASHCESVVAPPSGPGTDYPCGLRANLCPDRATCCPLDYDCGDGLHGCPADACCYGGSSMVGASQDASADAGTCTTCRTPAKETR